MIKQWWLKFEDISHWIVLVCFIIAFIPNLPSWAFLPLAVFAMPSFIAMNLKQDRERNQRIYDKGYEDGQSNVNNQEE